MIGAELNDRAATPSEELSHSLLWALPASALWGLGAWFRCGATPSDLAWLIGCGAWSLPCFALAWTTLRTQTNPNDRNQPGARLTTAQRWAVTLGLGVAWSMIPASILAALIKQHTHLRPLGAVTLAVLATLAVVGASLVAGRVLQMVERRGSKRTVVGLVAASLLIDLAYLSPHLNEAGIAGLLLDLGSLTVLLFAGQRLAEKYLDAAGNLMSTGIQRGAWLLWLVMLAVPWFVGPGGTESAPIIEGLPGLLVR